MIDNIIKANTQNPFFSIVLPAFNVEKYIHRSILSILTQSFQNFELIVVNDGSTDNTANIIDEFSKQNQKITVVTHQKNESLHMARLNGVAASKGNYVVFLDGDDYFVDNSLATLHEVIETNPGYDAYEYAYIRQPSGKAIFPTFFEADRFPAFFREKNCPEHTMWNKAYDAKVLKMAFLAMEKVYLNHAEDLYESIVISHYAEKIFSSNEIITAYMVGEGISTMQKNYYQVIECLEAIKKTICLIKKFLHTINKTFDIDILSYRIMTPIIQANIREQKNIEDKINLIYKLPDYFGNKAVLKYYINQEISLNNKICSITDSYEYKIGRKLLQPLRKIKNIYIKMRPSK